jgi:hypothetical protein
VTPVEQLRAIVFAVWSGIHPGAATSGDAPVIADAIAVATAEDLARGYVDAPLEAAVLAGYAWAESRLRLQPPPDAWDARAGVSCGPWQLRCAWVRGMAPVDQARLWLRLLHASSLASLDSSPARAARRLAKASALLERVSASMQR